MKGGGSMKKHRYLIDSYIYCDDIKEEEKKLFFAIENYGYSHDIEIECFVNEPCDKLDVKIYTSLITDAQQVELMKFLESKFDMNYALVKLEN